MSENESDFPEVDLTDTKVNFVMERMRALKSPKGIFIDDPIRRAVIALCRSWLETHGDDHG